MKIILIVHVKGKVLVLFLFLLLKHLVTFLCSVNNFLVHKRHTAFAGLLKRKPFKLHFLFLSETISVISIWRVDQQNVLS